MTPKKKPAKNPLLWVVESIMEEPSYIDRAWFGCRAIYLHGRLMIVLCSGEEPWNGVGDERFGVEPRERRRGKKSK
jgi:hypothetical protein